MKPQSAKTYWENKKRLFSGLHRRVSQLEKEYFDPKRKTLHSLEEEMMKLQKVCRAKGDLWKQALRGSKVGHWNPFQNPEKRKAKLEKELDQLRRKLQKTQVQYSQSKKDYQKMVYSVSERLKHKPHPEFTTKPSSQQRPIPWIKSTHENDHLEIEM